MAMITGQPFAVWLFGHMHTLQLDVFLIFLLIADVIATVSELFLEISLLKRERDLEAGFCGLDTSTTAFFCYGTQAAYTGPHAEGFMEEMAKAEDSILALEEAEHVLGFLGAVGVSVFIFENIVMMLLVGHHFFKDTIRVFDLLISCASLAFIILFYTVFQESLTCEAKQLSDAAEWYHHAYAAEHAGGGGGGSAGGHRFLAGLIHRVLNSDPVTAAAHTAANHTTAAIHNEALEAGCAPSLDHLYEHHVDCGDYSVAALAGNFLVVFRAWRFVRVMHGIYTETEKFDMEVTAARLKEDIESMQIGYGGTFEALQIDLNSQLGNWDKMDTVHDETITKMQQKFKSILKEEGFDKTDAGGKTLLEWQAEEVQEMGDKLKKELREKVAVYKKGSQVTPKLSNSEKHDSIESRAKAVGYAHGLAMHGLAARAMGAGGGHHRSGSEILYGKGHLRPSPPSLTPTGATVAMVGSPLAMGSPLCATSSERGHPMPARNAPLGATNDTKSEDHSSVTIALPERYDTVTH